MKLLCITNPKTHPPFDTTVELYRRFAEHKEIELFHAPCLAPSKDGAVLSVSIPKPLSYDEFLSLDNRVIPGKALTDFDLIFDRSDMPFPSGHLSSLSSFESKVQFVNRPSSLIQFEGRAFLSEIAKEFIPDSLFTHDVTSAVEFLNKHKVIVAKKNVSYGGKGVFKIWNEQGKVYSENIIEGRKTFNTPAEVFESLFSLEDEPYHLVRFLKNIAAGDKRVLVVEGEVYGGYIRKSSTGSWVHNITSGAKGIASEVTEREKEIIARTVSFFQNLSVYTLGYDFLLDDNGEWILSEINAGNNGGYDRLEQLSGKPVISHLIEWLIQSSSNKKFLNVN